MIELKFEALVGGIATSWMENPVAGGKKPYNGHLKAKLGNPDSDLKKALIYLLPVLKTTGRVVIRPVVDCRGFFTWRMFIFVLSADEAENKAKLELIRDWLMRPENNRFFRTYMVPDDWNVTPEVPRRLAEACTARDVLSFLTHVFWCEDIGKGYRELPYKWASNNLDKLSNFADIENMSDELKRLLDM